MKRLVLVAPKLQELTMFAVGTPKTVLVFVRLFVHALGKQRLVIPFLELDGAHARSLGLSEQLLGLLDVALVVVPDLGDDVAVRVVSDLVRADPECPCQRRSPC